MSTFSTIMDPIKNGSTGKGKKQISCQSALTQSGLLYYPRKFEMVSEFVTSIQDVLAISDRHNNGSAYRSYHTTQYILKYAFIEYPVPGINYEKVMVTRGNLWNTQKATAKVGCLKITFTWIKDIGVGIARSDDRSIIVAYCPALNKCIFTKEGGERQADKAELAIPEFRSQKVHTWLGFISADGSRIANSIYTGEVIVT